MLVANKKIFRIDAFDDNTFDTRSGITFFPIPNNSQSSINYKLRLSKGKFYHRDDLFYQGEEVEDIFFMFK